MFTLDGAPWALLRRCSPDSQSTGRWLACLGAAGAVGVGFGSFKVLIGAGTRRRQLTVPRNALATSCVVEPT